MGAEKESSKSGGYAGGFFQLFDWTAKSRKKLFSSKPDLPVIRVDDTDEYIGKLNDSTKVLDCRRSSPISVLEPSCSTESCSSLDSTDSGGTEESKPCSSVHSQEAIGLRNIDAKLDLSRTASSASTGTVSRNNTNIKCVADFAKSTTAWETECIKKIFLNLELTFQDFAMGRAQETINPRLFDQLEIWKDGLESNVFETRLERKLLFDCISECLDLKCRQYVNGGYGTWMKGVTMLKRKEKLAVEVYKEIAAWKGMGDSTVDELVDKDMSCEYGRWLSFEVDASVLAVEVEGQIFSSLVNEYEETLRIGNEKDVHSLDRRPAGLTKPTHFLHRDV